MTDTIPIDTVSVPATLAGDYAIRMQGDGMSPCIEKGDLLVVRKVETAEDGQVAVVKVNGEATVRRYSKDGTEVRLAADSSTVEDITAPAADVLVMGVVVGLVRSLR